MEYWKKRALQRMLKVEKESAKTINQILSLYDKALKDITHEIKHTFNIFADNGELTQKQALELLNKVETDEYYEKILQEIAEVKGRKLKIKLLSKYNAPAYASRISRLESIRNVLEIKIKKLYIDESKLSDMHFKNIIDYSYNNTIFDMQKDIGYFFNFTQINEKMIDILLMDKWIANGNYSSRIWNNNEMLSAQLKRILTSGLTTGKSIEKMSNELEEIINVGKHKITRLIRTESNFFCNQAELLAYKETNTEEYVYLATLDTHTCNICRQLDLKTFKVENAAEGINYPPIHPNDRCTTVPKVNSEYLKTRIARDEEGNSIKVPADMNYEEYYKKYLERSE